ncbi:MAG: hypothetical protein ACTSSI_08415 [Candidatus Helarchaeota archaeon]
MKTIFKFTLSVINLLVITLLFFYIPTSTLVWLAYIPALVYSIYSRRLALSAIAFTVFFVVILIYMIGLLFPLQIIQFFQNVAIVLFLYTKLFPYDIEINLLTVLDYSILSWIVLLILGILIASVFLRYSELHVMLSFSYFTLLFSLFYLVLNVLMFLIPPLQVVLETFLFTRWMLIFFYVIVPLLTLLFTLLFVENYAASYKERNKYEKQNQALKKKKSGKVGQILKYIAIFAVIFFVR